MAVRPQWRRAWRGGRPWSRTIADVRKHNAMDDPWPARALTDCRCWRRQPTDGCLFALERSVNARSRSCAPTRRDWATWSTTSTGTVKSSAQTKGQSRPLLRPWLTCCPGRGFMLMTGWMRRSKLIQLPLLNRVLIALRTVHARNIPERSEWAHCVEEDRVMPCIDAALNPAEAEREMSFGVRKQ